MAIFKKDKEITSVYYGTRIIAAIYDGAKLVWEAVRSCFGKGFWVNESSWDNDEGWKNLN
jgi:hypothetical protein